MNKIDKQVIIKDKLKGKQISNKVIPDFKNNITI
jgi:hypothetical protein